MAASNTSSSRSAAATIRAITSPIVCHRVTNRKRQVVLFERPAGLLFRQKRFPSGCFHFVQEEYRRTRVSCFRAEFQEALLETEDKKRDDRRYFLQCGLTGTLTALAALAVRPARAQDFPKATKEQASYQDQATDHTCAEC